MVTGGTNTGSWTLTYDEDNRTTSIRFTTPTNSTLIQNHYDALGRRLSKTVDGVSTGYVLSLAGGMERILCDVDNGGTVTAWYVHGPDLGYRVDAASNLVCYHADALANIIALTGANGTNLAQYAYSPYGRVLASSHSPSTLNSQPNTFVGSQGVMEELPGLFFMRARYYSADAGVFLSTDPVKNIGPTWRPQVYAYAGGNPNAWIDPHGRDFGSVISWVKSTLSSAISTAGTIINSIRTSLGIGSPGSSTATGGASGSGNAVAQQSQASFIPGGAKSSPTTSLNGGAGSGSAANLNTETSPTLSGKTPSAAQYSTALNMMNTPNGPEPLQRPAGGGITSGFGPRTDPINGNPNQVHKGVDIGGKMGDPVVATYNGKVVWADLTGDAGNAVIIDHGNGTFTRYYHMEKIQVQVGQDVSKGVQIGTIGTTGRSTGPHLHFELLTEGDVNGLWGSWGKGGRGVPMQPPFN
jgi:RHS repeat-associated protein